MADTPLWREWDVAHVATHRDGSKLAKILAFARSVPYFVYLLVARRPRAVHLNTSSSGSFVRKYILYRLARLFRVPVVLHVHGGGIRQYYDDSPALVRAALRDALGNAAAVVALGESWGTKLREIAPGARIVVVPNAVKLGEPVDQSVDDDPVRVLFLGQIADAKGTFSLIEAWGTLGSGDDAPPNAELVVAGGGEIERARALVAELGVTESVDIRGWVDPAEVPALVRSSQILVLPSHYEGQPMAILEAMANGLCVIACPVGGIPDLIDEDSGVFVPVGDSAALADAIRRVIDDHAVRIRLGTNAFRRAETEFDVDVVWRRFDALYREVGR